MDKGQMPKQSEASGKSHAGIQKSRKEEQEFGPGEKDIMHCRACASFYYHKSWHHNLRDCEVTEDKYFRITTCPACQMAKDGRFEGEVTFENIPNGQKQDVLNNIKNTGERAYKRDPMDRIIKIKESGDRIEVLTTENQLARNIARQIERAFKGTQSETKWSKEESVARVIVRFS